MANTIDTPKASQEKTPSNSISKTAIILIILIVISAIGLVATIAAQNRGNQNPSTTRDVRYYIPHAQNRGNQNPSTTPTDQVTIVKNTPSTSSNPIDLKAERESRIPEILITQAEIDESVKAGNCWAIIDGVVYDTTDFLREAERSLNITREEDICGKDITKIVTEEREGQSPIAEFGPSSPYYRPIGKFAK